MVDGLLDGALRFKRNKLNNVYTGIMFVDNFGSILECSFNDIYSSTDGILIIHGDVPVNDIDPDYLYQYRALYRIKHNSIQITFAGIELMDLVSLIRA
ncbi:MAG: hypothetical protein HWN80_00805 [Candidatus Lokiarchaeota archaeon]|nr:hypothetical protein [Candidatus Lokiarchaeota archaeon]